MRTELKDSENNIIGFANINFDGLHLIVETQSVKFDKCNLDDTVIEFRYYKPTIWQRIKNYYEKIL